jgi:hypothetical protein
MNKQITDRPYVVGYYCDGQKNQFLPLSTDEIGRNEWFYRHIVDDFNLPQRSMVLLISNFADGAFTAPFEKALNADGYIVGYAEATFDAPRVETFLRRFKNIPAVAGVTIDTLTGLEAAGHVPARLLAGRTVWVRDDQAYQKLQGNRDITLRRWMQIGPAPAMECIKGGGLHIDGSEWMVEAKDGEIVLTTRLARIVAFNQAHTGVRGGVITDACDCGSCDPRAVLAC